MCTIGNNSSIDKKATTSITNTGPHNNNINDNNTTRSRINKTQHGNITIDIPSIKLPNIPTTTPIKNQNMFENTSNNNATTTANNSNNNNTMASPSPLSPTTISPSLSLLTSLVSATILDPIHYFSLMIPEGAPTAEERQELVRELAEIHEATVEARQACTAVHGSIQQYQQLVLSTHAQVAAAKLALVQARELVSSNGNMNNRGVCGDGGKQGRKMRGSRERSSNSSSNKATAAGGGGGSMRTSRSSYFPPCTTIGPNSTETDKETEAGAVAMVSTLSSSSLNMANASPFIPSSCSIASSPLSPSSPFLLSRSYSYTSSTLSTLSTIPSLLPNACEIQIQHKQQKQQQQLKNRQWEEEEGAFMPVLIHACTTETSALLSSPTTTTTTNATVRRIIHRSDSTEEEDESDGDATTTSSGRNANSFDESDSPSSSSSSSSPSSDVDDEDEDMETRLDKLGERHAILGRQLSQLLRDKAAAEETKKRLNDGLLRAKARIKAIELKLGE
ncbi:hypothetical protein BGX33_010776 [Mortierella sp. NVP41]|nr:hypothetical protein BGX33_010776 [Mortierella sp. NVP41]